jgi:hypothetical protein
LAEYRYAVTELAFGRRRTTVRVADCEPGAEVQVDFGPMTGLVFTTELGGPVDPRNVLRTSR